MNIKHFLSAAAALTMLAACSEYDPGESGNVVDLTDAEIKTIQEYTENFVERYGEMDPNHTWGFGAIDSELGTRTNSPNNNEWVAFDYTDVNNLTTLTGYHYTTVNNTPVPGFPSYVDQKYYTTQIPAGATWEELSTWMKTNNQNQVNPTLGDVTDEEIMYVSAWFRTHSPVTSDKCEVDNFFVQEISKDFDRTYYGTMTGLDANGNGTQNWAETTCGAWDKNIPIIHYDENGKVLTTNPNNNQAWTGSDAATTMEFKLDQLSALDKNGQVIDHIYNENAGNTTQISDNNPTGIDRSTWSAVGQGITGTSYRSMMYFTNSTTADFKAFSSSESGWEYKWVLKHLTFKGRDGKNYDGWYLAFDVKYDYVQESYGNGTPKKKAYKDYDGYYSNYIVKITPGFGSTNEEYDITTESEQEEQPRTISRRVMCEDLGTTDDFDFNDVVFDVTYSGKEVRTKTTTTKKKKNTEEIISTTVTYTDWAVDGDGWSATITLQASGGTLPIYVENLDNAKTKYECHEYLLGANHAQLKMGEKYNPINVGANVNNIAAKALPTVTGLNTANPDDINIIVYSANGDRANNQLILPKSREGQYDGTSKAPQKLCVPVDTRWMKEYQQIESVYTYFRNWVQKENSEYNFGETRDWTKNGLQNTDRLY